MRPSKSIDPSLTVKILRRGWVQSKECFIHFHLRFNFFVCQVHFRLQMDCRVLWNNSAKNHKSFHFILHLPTSFDVSCEFSSQSKWSIPLSKNEPFLPNGFAHNLPQVFGNWSKILHYEDQRPLTHPSFGLNLRGFFLFKFLCLCAPALRRKNLSISLPLIFIFFIVNYLSQKIGKKSRCKKFRSKSEKVGKSKIENGVFWILLFSKIIFHKRKNLTFDLIGTKIRERHWEE